MAEHGGVSVLDITAPFDFPTGNGRIYNDRGQLFLRYRPGPENQLIAAPYGGELDCYSAPSLREFLIEAVNNRFYAIVMSLEEVDFIDSTGLGVVVGALKRVRAHDGSFDIVCTQERLLKIFRISGLTKVFGIFDTVSEALLSRGAALSPEQVDQQVETSDWMGWPRGRHPKTGTVHLAGLGSHSANEIAGEPIFFARCGRTSAPLKIITAGTISCRPCRQLAIQS